MMKDIFTKIALLLILAMCGFKAEAQIKVNVDSAIHVIGERIPVELVFDSSVVYQSLSTSTLDSNNNAVDWIDPGSWVQVGNRWEARGFVMAFDSGRLEIPSIKIIAKSNDNTDTLTTLPAFINSVTLPVSDTTSIAPIQDILSSPGHWTDQWPWLLGILIFLLLILAGIFIVRHRRSVKRKARLLNPVSAGKMALAELDRLDKMQFWQQGKVKEYQIELTAIMRNYIQSGFGVEAFKLSSLELDEVLHGMKFDSLMLVNLKNLLSVADFVKFGKAIPPEEVHATVINMARQFIQNTQGKIKP